MSYQEFRECAKYHDSFEFCGKEVILYSHHIIEKSGGAFDIFVDLDGQTFAGDIYDPIFLQKFLSQSNYYFHVPHGIVVQRIDRANIRDAIRQMLKDDRLAEIFVKSE